MENNKTTLLVFAQFVEDDQQLIIILKVSKVVIFQ